MSSIAIVGQGYMGAAHAGAWNAVGRGGDIRYICTPRPRGAWDAAPNAQLVTDLADVISDPAVTMVSVCTPTLTHRDITMELLRAGKHVLLEKPIALSLADAAAIQEAADVTEGSVMIAQVVRFFAGYQRVRDVVADGAIGEVRSVRAQRMSTRPAWAAWLVDEDQSGGTLVDFAIHDFDQANLFLGEPVAVTSKGAGDFGPFSTLIEYRSGAVAQVLSHADLPADAGFFSGISLVGSGGTVDYEFNAADPTEQSAGGVSAGFRVFTPAGATVMTIDDDDPYARQAQYFADQIAAGGDFADCSLESAVTALEVALAAQTSYRSQSRVEIAAVRH